MRKPRTKDDYWYNKITNAQPKKTYRECPKCGMRTGISEPYTYETCFMCGSMIYLDEELNEKEKQKYKFMNELKRKGIKTNAKKIIRK